MKTKADILLVEDDKNLGFDIADFLTYSGYKVLHVENGQLAIDAFKINKFDMCLLDVMLPLKDGFSVAEEIRKTDAFMPIIFLTARVMKEDRIRGFKIGADDYITKPFSTEELVLRIEAILRRTRLVMQPLNHDKETYQIGQYLFDSANQELVFSGEKRGLTKKEAELLKLLCQNVNNLVRRDYALKQIWGEDDYFMGRSMDVYITKLRKLLKDDTNISILNIHRTGFKLEVKE
jgi:two-component system, OmpR family, response regulator